MKGSSDDDDRRLLADLEADVTPERQVPWREVALAVCWLVAAAMVATGAALVYVPAGWIAGGVLLAAFGWLVLGEASSSGET